MKQISQSEAERLNKELRERPDVPMRHAIIAWWPDDLNDPGVPHVRVFDARGTGVPAEYAYTTGGGCYGGSYSIVDMLSDALMIMRIYGGDKDITMQALWVIPEFRDACSQNGGHRCCYA